MHADIKTVCEPFQQKKMQEKTLEVIYVIAQSQCVQLLISMTKKRL